MTWSPDTAKWHRISPGTPLIPNSKKEGDYDWGCVYAAACPVFLEDKILLYYGGSDGLHTSWRSGSFCLATLRADGFAGYEQVERGSNKTAIIITKPVVAVTGSLCLSADIAMSGYVKVTIFDKEHTELAEAELITKMATDVEVHWKDGFSFEKLKGKEIKLRFELRDSKLYSFSFK